MMFKGNLSSSQKEQKGYAEKFDNWICHGKIHHSDLNSGPCTIYLDVNALPVSEQLWPYIKKVIAKVAQLMDPLLKSIGVTDADKSPFCKKFKTRKELMREYVKYYPWTFSFNDLRGEQEEDYSIIISKI